MASNLPFGSGVISNRVSQAHQIHVSTLSGRGASPYPTSYAEPTDGVVGDAGPVSCFLSAVGVSLLDPPAPAEGLVLPCGRITRRIARLDLIGVVVFRMSEMRPGWVSSEPRGRRCAPEWRALSIRRLPLSCGQSYHPLVLPINGSLLDEASSRIHLHSPVRSSPACNPWMEQEPLGLDLRLRTPWLPATHAEAGTDLAHGSGSYAFDISRTSLAISTQLKRPHVASARGNSA